MVLGLDNSGVAPITAYIKELIKEKGKAASWCVRACARTPRRSR
jgi:hypothetical protein